MNAAEIESLIGAVVAVLLAFASWLRSRTTQSQLRAHQRGHAVSNTPPVTTPGQQV